MDQAAVLFTSEVIQRHVWLAPLVVAFAQVGIFVLPAGLALIWLWPPGDAPLRRRTVVAAATAFVLAALLSQLLTPLVDRPRPFVGLGLVPLVAHPADSSFPSDHTLLGVSLAGPIAWRWPRRGGALVAWALLVGAARVAAGVHYPTDVLGSALLAALPTVAGLAVTRLVVPLIPAALARRVGLVAGHPPQDGAQPFASSPVDARSSAGPRPARSASTGRAGSRDGNGG